MRGVNVIHLVGQIGADPEVKYLPSGDAVVEVSVATSEQWKDKNGEKQERTDWHRCVAFGRTAEVIGEYVRKGDPIYLSGPMRYEQYEKDGIKRTNAKVRIEQMRLLGGKKDGGGNSGSRGGAPKRERPAPAPQPAGGFADDFADDDIPF